MRTRIMLAAVLAALLTVAGVTLASADSNGSSDDTNGRVIKLFSVTDPARSTVVDVAPTGDQAPSLGDEFVFSDDLFDHKGGMKVGIDGVVCTVVRLEPVANPTDATLQCVATISLAGGQITVQGLFPAPLAAGKFPPPSDLPVTGGTGAYEGAEGHFTVEEINDTESNLTVSLED